jgi:hypothetical protein
LAYNTKTELKQVLIASGASADVTGVVTGGYGYEYQVRFRRCRFIFPQRGQGRGG